MHYFALLMITLFLQPEQDKSQFIAHYYILNSANQDTSDFYVLSTDNWITEVVSDRKVATIFYSTYDLLKRERKSHIHIHNSGKVIEVKRTFDELRTEKYTISHETTGEMEILKIERQDGPDLAITLSPFHPDISHFHLLYPEIKTLPLVVDFGQKKYVFNKFVTDSDEQMLLMNTVFKDPVGGKSIIHEDVLEDFIMLEMEMTLPEYVERLKQLRQEK